MAGQAGAYDDVGARAAGAVVHLAGDDAVGLGGRHGAPGDDPLTLQRARRRHRDDEVAIAVSAGLEQERNVEDDERSAGGSGAGEEPGALATDEWMNDPLENRKERAILQDRAAQTGTVDAAPHERAGNERRDRRDGIAARSLEPVDRGVGVEDRDLGAAEQSRDRGFTHGDAAGEPDHAQGARVGQVAGMSIAIRALTSASMSGSTPNQAVKPGLAWWSSMPSPSTVRSPRAAASASRRVCSGT